jgi:hypothetical protein
MKKNSLFFWVFFSCFYCVGTLSFCQQQKSTATFETQNVVTEQSQFLYYSEAVKVNSDIFDHTKLAATKYSTRLNGSPNERLGLAKSLSVKPGDVVDLEVYAKYLDANSASWTSTLQSLITSIVNGTALPGTFVDGGALGSTGGVTPQFSTLLNKSSQTGTAPKAFLNFLVFDLNYKLLTGGFVRITASSREYGQKGPHDRLARQLQITQAGYVYIYLSNDNLALGGSAVEVYFDDMAVTLTPAKHILDETGKYFLTEDNKSITQEN